LAISDVLAGVALPHLQNLAPSQNQLVCQSAFEPVVEFKDRSGASLTSRENETLKLVAEGKCNKEIATALGLSPKTIDTYRQRIMSKLDLHSQSDLIRYAIRRGLAKP
jgi:DNA-binding NarL/FixJ family response regulator